MLLVAAAATAGAAPKTDVIELLNGDRVTCEIRSLDHGKVTVETDGLGTIAIEWDDVERLTSPATYDIELDTGARYFGSFAGGASRIADVSTAAGVERLPLERIVRISPVGQTFWRRLDGSFSGGFTFTQANVQTQLTLHADVQYRSRRWYSTLTGDSALTASEGDDRQTRNSLTIETRRYLHPLWSVAGFSQLQQNEELSLAIRAVLGGGLERTLTQSNRLAVGVVGGAAYTQEHYTDAEGQSVPEAVAGLSLDWFTFDGRSTNLGVDLMSFFSLDGKSRGRLESSTTFRSDIVSDVYWSVNTFESYNSQPPAGEKHNDFGVSATIGWSF